MIDVSQWRASIGLWNCCQAASRRPAIGCYHSHSLKATMNSKSSSTMKLGETASKLAAPNLLFLFLFLSVSLSIHIFMIPLTCNFNYHQVQCNTDVNYLQSVALSKGLSCNDLYLTVCLRKLLLLSGDVELNPGPLTGNPKDVLRSHSSKLISVICSNLLNITNELHAARLIPKLFRQEMLVPAVDSYTKATKLVNVIEQQLESSLNPVQYLTDISRVLLNQQDCTLTDITTSILHQLGQSVSDVLPPLDPINDTPIKGQSNVSSIPDDVQVYADDMRQYYKHQPIVATDWPPRIGKDFFGRLALVEKQDHSTQAESAWHLLRGQVDKIVKLTKNKEISVEDVLKPTNDSLSLRVVIDGPPGIGKTVLCRKLLNMWSNGTLVPQQYDLVLYCPLRSSQIATATTLAELFEFKSPKVSKAVDWLSDREGKGLLIIFDGWDELSEQLKKSSIATSIIHRKQLRHCSVVVTSRSYASVPLLEMNNLSRHVQVIGFLKHEISIVIIQTLQKDEKLAQELIDENKTSNRYFFWASLSQPQELNSHVEYKPLFATVQSNKDSQLAVKLINDLKVRSDVLSLCYIPLVCSMVILVYCKEGGHLPTTLTLLYENFILQTIRRHVKRHDINPCTLASLSSLPSELCRPLEDMCRIAYTNLANNTKMVFSLHELQSLSEVVKEDYLGLMTRFTEYDEEKYQFLHLSIQEFLAAWWIVKHEKTEEVFQVHFDDDHFRMCLRFVAGQTHLDHKSYQQYFTKQLDLRCKRVPLFGFESCHLSYFFQNFEIRNYGHIKQSDMDKVPILLFQLLYESQNTILCQIFAQSINNYSLCLDSDRVSLSLFDWLCLSYFINNSNIIWNHLQLGDVSKQAISVFTAGLTNNSLQIQCKRMEVNLDDPTDEVIQKLLQSSLLYNIQECYCELVSGQYVSCLVLLQFLNLHQLKILHLTMTSTSTVGNAYADKCAELEKCIAMNSTLEEIKIGHSGEKEVISNTIISVIRGVTKNKKITSFSIFVYYPPTFDDDDPPLDPSHSLPDGVIEQLLKDNNILQALSLDIADKALLSSLNIVEVNTPLVALEIGRRFRSSKLMTSLLPHIKGLHCLILYESYSPQLLFSSHPNLHTLTLQLNTAETVVELFTILQTNTTLKVLDLEIMGKSVYTSSMGTSLQGMLTQNQTLKCLKIHDYVVEYIPNSFLSFLITGLRHNVSLQQLYVLIPLSKEILVSTFTDIISQKNNLTELTMSFALDESILYSIYSEMFSDNISDEEDEEDEEGEEELLLQIKEMESKVKTLLLYEQILPAVTNMLLSHRTIRLLTIGCFGINSKLTHQPNWIENIQHFYETVFIHPSLEYIKICTGRRLPPLTDTLKDQKKTLIDKHRKEQPNKPLPIVDIQYLR